MNSFHFFQGYFIIFVSARIYISVFVYFWDCSGYFITKSLSAFLNFVCVFFDFFYCVFVQKSVVF